ncbi:hypothetical protein [Salinarimonas soli]|uniref:UrcA family protein n=1 Tax=Salinarimonas soli TaxID=1638099 RepID=A0A5B2UWU1_9HYPH|nr:hypothetical protein [Salinarimonas soli]KAA2231326.1 hypothetical protein F0L46_25290 [Salinarimonas soli]
MVLRAVLAVSVVMAFGPVAVQAADAARAGVAGRVSVGGLLGATRQRLEVASLRMKMQRDGVSSARARASECRSQIPPRPEAGRPATRMGAYRECLARG